MTFPVSLCDSNSFCSLMYRMSQKVQTFWVAVRLAPSLFRSLFGPTRSTVRCEGGAIRSLRLLHLRSGLSTEWA